MSVVDQSRFSSSTLEEYQSPMEVPAHIYVDGVPRKPGRETRPQMVVPGRITLGGGNTTVAAKTQPVEVIRERQNLFPPNSDNDGINISGIPQMLTANELPQEDFPLPRDEANSHENPHYTSQTSIAVDGDPLTELKLVRRRLKLLYNRVDDLEKELIDRPGNTLIYTTFAFSLLSILIAAYAAKSRS